jgi:hypothetical protein
MEFEEFMTDLMQQPEGASRTMIENNTKRTMIF